MLNNIREIRAVTAKINGVFTKFYIDINNNITYEETILKNIMVIKE